MLGAGISMVAVRGGTKVNQKPRNSGYSLKMRPRRLAHRLDTGWEKKKEIKNDTEVWGFELGELERNNAFFSNMDRPRDYCTW